MKLRTTVLNFLVGSLCLTFIFSISIFSQTQKDTKKRKVRYISSKIKKKPDSLSIINGNKKRKGSLRKLTSGGKPLAQKAFKLINKERAKIGIAPVKWHKKLAKVAVLHSENMAKYNFFNHIGLGGTLVDDRAKKFGLVEWSALGENIAFNKGIANPSGFAVERWMISRSHRLNLLDKRWTHSAIGTAVTEDGYHYFTQVFLEK